MHNRKFAFDKNKKKVYNIYIERTSIFDILFLKFSVHKFE